MEAVIAFLLFILIMLVIQNRKLIKEIRYLEDKVYDLEAQIDKKGEQEEISPLDLSEFKFMV
tara:strand:+ start:199 stop:384 length:186 start_codon:yes stop_codon:yes gene_type:complete